MEKSSTTVINVSGAQGQYVIEYRPPASFWDTIVLVKEWCGWKKDIR